ncbi:MAG: polyphosphate:AMP phosphotransferase [Lachnospiraceae bacterium]|nr:polyphosphate:AMP phosphotransferase [Lachnospiraceae bacterium]
MSEGKKKEFDKKELKAKIEKATERLSLLERQAREAKIPILITFDGFSAAGKGLQINRLIQAMDPRGFDVFAFGKEGEESKMHPFLWRYAIQTPADGRIAIFDTSWYRHVQKDLFDGKTKESELDDAFYDICAFEQQLIDSGMVLIKLFLSISQKEQKRRFEKLEDSKETSWRVNSNDWKRNAQYEKFEKINENMIARSENKQAPWIIIDANEGETASLAIMLAVIERLEKALADHAKGNRSGKYTGPIPEKDQYKKGILSKVDLTKSLEKKEYKEKLDKLQKKIEKLHSELYRQRIPVVLCFEGWDAAGKGGAIKRLTSHMDPRGYKVCPTPAPNSVEKAHHYLWRFWNNVPKDGHIAIYDRTWYGRVMVERIEGFCTEDDWRRAYKEINDFEAHLIHSGAVVLKFWIDIDKDEQERRFNERVINPAKQWKITDEDWRNREKWDRYEEAVNEMIANTSTEAAPWIVVEGNSKLYARIKVLKAVVKTLEEKIEEVEKVKG